MIIFPAIDIKNGKCVRLIKGDFKNQTTYEQSPFNQAKKYVDHGFKNIHMVDLDGALTGSPVNIEIIKLIKNELNVDIQIGGGIRSMDSIKRYIDIGVKQIILGSIAIKNTTFFHEACEKFKDRISLALDVDAQENLKISAWQEDAKYNVKDFIKKIFNYNFKRIIYTDIERDGTKQGPDIKGSLSIATSSNKPVIISGGISSMDDIVKIKKLNDSMIYGVIIGKAIYDGNIDLNKLSKLI